MDLVTKPKVLWHLNKDPFDPSTRKSYNDESTRKLFESHPEAAAQKYTFVKIGNVYPLLMLCCLAPSKATTEIVYKGNPRAIQATDPKHGWTPLFVSLKFTGMPTDTVLYLIDEFPRAISAPALDQWTPLHLACSNKAPIEIVKVMVERAPETLTMTNNLNWTPLHLAVGYDAPTEVVQLLVEK